MKEIFKIVFWLFFIESTLILIGMWTGYVSYGRELGSVLMEYGIILGLACSIIVRIAIRKFDTPTQKVVAGFFIGIMIFLCFYYLLEDHFTIKL